MRKQSTGRKLRNNAVRLTSLVGLAILLFGFAPRAIAGDHDPLSRAARLAYPQGAVSSQPAGTDGWVTAGLNRPVTKGDQQRAKPNQELAEEIAPQQEGPPPPPPNAPPKPKAPPKPEAPRKSKARPKSGAAPKSNAPPKPDAPPKPPPPPGSQQSQ